MWCMKSKRRTSLRPHEKSRFRGQFDPANPIQRPKWRGNCEYSIFRFGNTTERHNSASVKFSGNMQIWYSERPQRNEDRGTGPGIFFGGPELPEIAKTRKKTHRSAR